MSKSRQKAGGLCTDFQNALCLWIKQFLSCQKRHHPVCHLPLSRFGKKKSRSTVSCGIVDGSRIGTVQFLLHVFQHSAKHSLGFSLMQRVTAVDQLSIFHYRQGNTSRSRINSQSSHFFPLSFSNASYYKLAKFSAAAAPYKIFCSETS